MARPFELAALLDRQMQRVRAPLAFVGWLCFALISADYAGFISLPTLVTIPLWLGIAVNLLRWAVWEGVIKPRIDALGDRRDSVGKQTHP